MLLRNKGPCFLGILKAWFLLKVKGPASAFKEVLKHGLYSMLKALLLTNALKAPSLNNF